MAAKQKCFRQEKKYVWNWLLCEKKADDDFSFFVWQGWSWVRKRNDLSLFETRPVFNVWCHREDGFGAVSFLISLTLSLTHTFLHARTHMPVYPHTHTSLFIHTFMHTHTPSKHCLTKTKLSFHVRSCLVLGRYTMNRSYVERILFWKSLKDLHLFSFSPLEWAEHNRSCFSTRSGGTWLRVAGPWAQSRPSWSSFGRAREQNWPLSDLSRSCLT